MATNLVFFNVHALVIYLQQQKREIQTEWTKEIAKANKLANEKRVYFMGTSIKLELLTFSLHFEEHIWRCEEVSPNGNPFWTSQSDGGKWDSISFWIQYGRNLK